jgi:alpha-mannosidase
VKANPTGTLPPEQSLLAVAEDNVVITGVKKAEDDDSLVVRFFESHARPSHATLKLPFDTGKVATVNLIEDKLSDESAPSVDLRACEIRTLKIATK